MDLEVLEALALAEDRTKILAQLLPGSEEHDYHAVLLAQHRGELDRAETLIEAWADLHGNTTTLERLRLRQRLYRLGSDPEEVADDVRGQLGVSHWHTAEVAERDPTRPTRLSEETFDGAKLLAAAVAEASDLSRVTDDGIDALLDDGRAATLDGSRRRALLARAGHTASPSLVALVVADLESGSAFGTLRAHGALTSDQLAQVAERVPKLRNDGRWLEAVIRRMRPPADVVLDEDRDAREAYLRALWQLARELPAAANSLKAHVLWHLLDGFRQRDAMPERELVLAYLQLPRSSGCTPRSLTEQVRPHEVAQLGIDLRYITGLPPAGSDEQLVRELVQRDLGEASHYAPWLETRWLELELATAQLLQGVGSVERATQTLGPSLAASLRDRIEIAWCAHNPTEVAASAPIALEVDVKNVSELVVHVFRVDPLAYFQHHGREVDTDIDLDGLAASHEQVVRLSEPTVRRVRRRIELAECTRPGTYVVDLIGNGMASRAVIRKGRLRHLVRVGAAGHVVTVLDEHGAAIPGARAWIGDREYTSAADGTLVVPFSTAPGPQRMLLAHGDVATVTPLELTRETYALAADIHLDRQALVEGGTARAIARVSLRVAGAPVTLTVLRDARWEITITDRHRVTTTKQYPLALSDDHAAVLEWPLGEAPSELTLSVRGTVRVISEQRDQELSAVTTAQIATMHDGDATEALYLARTDAGWVISALGKSGEPRAHRPLAVALTHRWALTRVMAELATDAQGRCELGALPGLATITATLGRATQTWSVAPGARVAATLHVPGGRPVALALPDGRDAVAVVQTASLVELRGGAPHRHVAGALAPLAGGVEISGLSPGRYELRAGHWSPLELYVPAPGVEREGHTITASQIVEHSRLAPVLAELDARDGLRLRVAGATSRTRVHVVATRFLDARLPASGPERSAAIARVDRPRPVGYVSGRELGDEYRYVLERRRAARYPSLQLDKPSLLLNPWSRRTTTTDVAAAREGTRFAAAGAPPAPAAYAGAREQSDRAVDHPAYASYDFVATPPAVLANLELDERGELRVAPGELGAATCALLIVDDPAGATVHRAWLPERPLAPKDLRLRLALAPDRHAMQDKQISPLAAGATIEIADLATAKLHLIDSVGRAHGYLLALRDDEALREWSFVTRWSSLADAERRELYARYACHELHLFLFFKDRAWFDAVVRPYLVHKRTKTFVDHWLLGADLSAYLEPHALARLNAVERALLARRLGSEPAVARLLSDEVELAPPSPERDTHLIDVLLGAARLDGDTAIAGAAAEAYDDALARAELGDEGSHALAPEEADSPPPPVPSSSVARASGPPSQRKRAAKRAMDADHEVLDGDLAAREQQAPMYRAADRTLEWAEHNWWRRTPAESGPEMIAANRFWRDLAQHDGGAFLSRWLGLASGSFAEALCALAVIDLPMVAASHAITTDGPKLAITAGSNMLVGSSQLIYGDLVDAGPPVVVGQSFVRADDRFQLADGERVDKYVDGPLLAGVVYTCQVVVANPSSTRQRVAVLIQLPRGSIALGGARPTFTLDVLLDAYRSHGHEYSFYVPAPGRYTHFPAHVSRGGAIVAAAAARELEVTPAGDARPSTDWAYVSQRGSVAEVVAFLERENLAAIDLERIAWRMRDREAYDQVLGVLERRRVYDDTLWGYALLHRDGVRIRTWARGRRDVLLDAGPVLDMPVVALDAEQIASYEHLEYAPLINARAHRLGPTLRILNEGLDTQYRRFLDMVAHRRAPSPEDLVAAAAYLFAQDRNREALAALSRVQRDQVASQLQYDYLVAYAACLTGDIARARELVARWRELPVERWRRKFEAIAGWLAEVEGATPAAVDPDSREQRHGELAASQPTFDLAVDREGVVVRQQHVASLELRMFEVDLELLFSRQPFVQGDVSRLSFVEPGHREALTAPGPEQRVPWPPALRGRNVVVEAVGAGLRAAKIHYANELATTLAHQAGQLRVRRASGGAPLGTTYVKVYARMRGGAIAFYKDGYTDLRGWFDYATLSTGELDAVERFAILVSSDHAGSAILEANPPAR